MKILFLDIDGVVNCATTMQRHRGAIGIDPYMALLVGRIIIATDAKIVLSSTWRLWEETRNEVRKQVHDFIDITPRHDLRHIRGEKRGGEIKEWLDKQFLKSDFPVTKYAILDDDNDMLPEQQDNFFKTSWQIGLTEEIANRVIKHLNS